MNQFYRSLLLTCCLSAFTFCSFAQVTYYEPVNATYLPSRTPNMPEWAKLLYKDSLNAFEIEAAFKKYYGNDAEEIEEKGDAYTRYYQMWKRKIEPFIQPDGSIKKITIQEASRLIDKSNKDFEAARTAGARGARSSSWTHVGPNETHYLYDDNSAQPQCPWQANVYAFDIAKTNANILVCGTESGHIYKTSNKGSTWTCLNNTYYAGNSIEAVEIDPIDTNIIYISSNNFIHRSTNGGSTWTQLPNSGFTLQANDIAIHATNDSIILLACGSGLYRSADKGNTWTQKLTNTCYDVELMPGTPNTMYTLRLNTGTNIVEFYKSTDKGVTWILSNTGWPTTKVNLDGARMTVTSNNTNMIYVCWLTSDTPYVMKSTNAGSSWSVVAKGNTVAFGMNNGQGYYDLSIAANDNVAGSVIIGTQTTYVSTDGGVTYTAVGGYAGSFNIHPDLQEVKSKGGDTWIGTDGGMTYSTDFFNNTANATAKTTGIDGTEFWGYDQGWNEDLMVGGRYHNGNTAMHENYPAGLALRMGGGEQATGYVLPMRTRTVAFSDLGNGWILPSTYYVASGGRFSFTKYPNESYPGDACSQILTHPLYYKTYYVGKDSSLWMCTDGGINYTQVKHFTNEVRKMQISRSNPSVLYVITDNAFNKTTDGGTTWSVVTPPSGFTDYVNLEITLSPIDQNQIWVLDRSRNSTSPKVYKSTDGGTSWTNITTATLDNHSYSNLVHAGGTNGGVYICSRIGNVGTGGGFIFYRDNTLPDWVAYNTNFPPGANVLRTIPFYRDAKLRICTGDVGRGIWESPLYNPNFTPVAQPTVDKQVSYCVRDTFYFDDYSILKQTGGCTWAWTVSPAPAYISSTSVRNPKVVLGAIGSYNVTLTVTDANSHSSSKTVTQMIRIDSSLCTPDSVPGLHLVCDRTNNGYAKTSTIALGTTNTVTITAWVKLNAYQTDYNGVVFSPNGSATGLNVIPLTGTNTIIGYTWNNDANTYNFTSGASIPLNTWTHLALVVYPDSARLYVNGVSVTKVFTHVAVNFSSPFNIGNDRDYTYRTFDGKIDEVCIYSRSLSQAEIRDGMHLTKKTGADATLLAYYQFNESTPTILDRMNLNNANFVNTGSRAISSVPVGGGVSARQTVTASGTYTFTGTGLSIKFPTSATYPNGELDVTRLNLHPDTKPSSYSEARSYWIVHNYGTNSTFTALSNMTFSNVGNVNVGATAATYKLYKRSSTADGATWGTKLDSASSVVTGTDGNVVFNGGLSLVTSFSQFDILSEGVVNSLPIELLTFTADVTRDLKVQLDWVVATEINVASYTVQRSKDGVNFTDVTTVPGAGNSTQTLQYQAFDSTPLTGISYYRLAERDKDGTITYTDTRSVYIPAALEGISIYPNPSTGMFRLLCSNLNPGKIQLTVYNTLGEVVKDYETNYLRHTFIDLSDQPNDTYFIKSVVEGVTRFNRVVVEK